MGVYSDIRIKSLEVDNNSGSLVDIRDFVASVDVSDSKAQVDISTLAYYSRIIVPGIADNTLTLNGPLSDEVDNMFNPYAHNQNPSSGFNGRRVRMVTFANDGAADGEAFQGNYYVSGYQRNIAVGNVWQFTLTLTPAQSAYGTDTSADAFGWQA